MADRPLVAVTGPRGKVVPGWWAAALSLWWAGGQPVRLTPRHAGALDLERFKAVVIGGGSDIDPELYGGLDTGVPPADPERDSFEIDVLEHVCETRLPLLGICRGAQLLNVVLEGSLHQDIRPMRKKTRNRRTVLPVKTALLQPKAEKLRELMGADRWKINSLHHQAMKDLGRDVVPAARDLDGFVQAIEVRDHPWIGVQWHPEYLFYRRQHLGLFRWLVDQARANAAE